MSMVGRRTVGGGGDGGELCVIRADALVHVHLQVEGLAGPQLRDEDTGGRGGGWSRRRGKMPSWRPVGMYLISLA